jgi:PKHD-type hydroxylase
MKNTYFIENKPSDFSNYYWFRNAIAEESITKIESELSETVLQVAVTGENNKDKSLRSSSIKWIPKTHNWKWVYEICTDLIVEANNNMWNLDISTMLDDIQYTEYYASENGHYDWHIDVGHGDMSYRKISLAIQLSDPESYEGGDLEIWLGGSQPLKVPRGLGNAVVFPSFYMHRVTPVLKGVRKSLVMWAGGTPYR